MLTILYSIRMNHYYCRVYDKEYANPDKLSKSLNKTCDGRSIMSKEVLIHQKMTRSILRVLRNEGYMLVDMHFHTRYSDGLASVKGTLAKAKRLGIGVAITDHNEIQAAVLASQQNEVPIIFGMEVTCQEGMHILLYFYKLKEYTQFFEKHIKPYRSHHPSSITAIPLLTLMEKAAKANCLVVAAHPYAVAWTGIMRPKHKKIVTRKLLKQFDAIEGLCGSSIKKWNKRSQKLAPALGKPMTGGSDGHTLREMGHVITYARASSPQQFLDQVRKGNACVIGKETNLMYNVGCQVVKIKNVSSAEEYIKRNLKGFVARMNGKHKHHHHEDEENGIE